MHIQGFVLAEKPIGIIGLGVVKVNNRVVIELGYQVQQGDIVHFDGKLITPEKKSYVLLNKPKGFITTTKDEHGRSRKP